MVMFCEMCKHASLTHKVVHAVCLAFWWVLGGVVVKTVSSEAHGRGTVHCAISDPWKLGEHR